MTTVFVFPGQGSQAVGMGADLARSAAEARAVFDRVDDALGQKLSSIIFEGSQEQLTLTANAQPALLAVSIAVLEVVKQRSGRQIGDLAAYGAGHSLGEYSALTAAGALDLEDAARLLRLRGEAMQAAVPVGQGAMAALLGLSIDDVEALLAEIGDAGICDIANDNAEVQVVISGERQAVEAVVDLSKGRGARRAMMLDVSAPFHCRLMEPAARRMEAALAEAAVKPPQVPVITNVAAEPETDPDMLRRLLVAQVTGRVRWRESMATMAALNAERIVELGAGKVLTGLAKRGVKTARGQAIETSEDIDAYLQELQ
ncbi:MAG: ACP S-malonyltransferase [Geminicoccaceae bacterium]